MRLVGEAQFKLIAFKSARDSFEALRRFDVNDLNANQRLGNPASLDRWGASSKADLLLTTSDNAERVADAYRRALADADQFTIEATRRNVEIFRDVGGSSSRMCRRRWTRSTSYSAGQSRRSRSANAYCSSLGT